ncbi:MAG: sigma-70 family RNA polymerase sigma factor [Firmicutes bacterium]|nr:sigma-70 family RNA polymerase sigma factor [Bacillota bacterium]
MFAVFLAMFPTLLNQLFLLISYVSNTNSFPPPLSPEEEKEYLLKHRNGDEDARNILIERNLRLVAHIIKKYSTTGKDADDLISIGTIGLIKAISTFDINKGTRLATYAARCIENAILTKMRSFLFKLFEAYNIDIYFSVMPSDAVYK